MLLVMKFSLVLYGVMSVIMCVHFHAMLIFGCYVLSLNCNIQESLMLIVKCMLTEGQCARTHTERARKIASLRIDRERNGTRHLRSLRVGNNIKVTKNADCLMSHHSPC